MHVVMYNGRKTVAVIVLVVVVVVVVIKLLIVAPWCGPGKHVS